MSQETFRVLVIDDERGLTEILDAFLTTAGYSVAAENEAMAGIEKAKTFKPHIILLDLQLKGMDGYEVSAVLKKDTRTADIPVVFLTGKEAGGDQRPSFKSGGNLWVKKPFSCERLLDIIKLVLLSVSK